MTKMVAIAGAMASGKTSVATAAAGILDVDVLSFGSLVRAEAHARGLAVERPTLQALGQEMALSDPNGMVRRLLDGRTSDVVLEGIRHLSVLEAVREVAPDLVFVYLAATPADLQANWARRGDNESLEAMAVHAVESEVPALQNEATLLLNGSRLSIESAAQIVATAARVA